MSDTGGKFAWAKKHYDRIMVVVVLFCVIVSSLYLSLRLTQDHTQLTLQTRGLDGQESRHDVQPLDTAEWDAKQEARGKPFQTGTITNWLLTSELRVRCANEECQIPIPYDADICPVCRVEQPDLIKLVDSDGDGVPDELEKAYALDPFDPLDVNEDKDGDGFSTREEFDLARQSWISNPLDADSFPPPASKIRLVKVKVTPFKMQFRGVQNLADGARYQLNMGGSSKFAKMNEVLLIKTRKHTEKYKVVAYKENVTQKGNMTVDESVLTLESNGKKYNLIKNKPVTTKDKLALMLFLVDKTPLKKRIGQRFELKGFHYKVIDIDRNGVLLEDTQTGIQTLAPRITPEELSALRKPRESEKKN